MSRRSSGGGGGRLPKKTGSNNAFFSIDEYLNKYFEQSDLHEERKEQFFKTYYKSLEAKREALEDDISEALWSMCDSDFSESMWRIVDVDYASDPICAVGSFKNEGQRFNIGNGLKPYYPFGCLYVADDDDTAYAERFHHSRSFIRTYSDGTINAHELALKKNSDGYTSIRLETNITKFLDLRDKKNLRPFCEVISAIKPGKDMLKYAKEVGIGNLRTIQTPGELLSSLMTTDFQKTPTVLSMPANPQWFGYYCLRAGIQAILYPSARRDHHFNLAILMDNFLDTDCTVRIPSGTSIIHETRKEMNKDNFEFFKHPFLVPKVVH